MLLKKVAVAKTETFAKVEFESVVSLGSGAERERAGEGYCKRDLFLLA